MKRKKKIVSIAVIPDVLVIHRLWWNMGVVRIFEFEHIIKWIRIFIRLYVRKRERERENVRTTHIVISRNKGVQPLCPNHIGRVCVRAVSHRFVLCCWGRVCVCIWCLFHKNFISRLLLLIENLMRLRGYRSFAIYRMIHTIGDEMIFSRPLPSFSTVFMVVVCCSGWYMYVRYTYIYPRKRWRLVNNKLIREQYSSRKLD